MTPLKETTSVCSRCLTKVPATVFEVEGEVVMHKRCPEHGEERALLASDAAHYYGTGPDMGCGPGGCGVGPFGSSCSLMFEITERCNLTCPTCFTASSPQETWMMPLADFEAQLQRALSGGRKTDIVQISGGEPTVHPEVEAIIECCFDNGIDKVYLNTNGVRLGREPDFAARLGRFHERLQIYLQFDGFRADTYAAIRGAKGLLDLKLRAIDNALEHGIYVLPVMTVTRGVNLDEIGKLFALTVERHPLMNSIMLQPAMYAGRYLNDQTYRRITVAEVAHEVEQQTKGAFTRADFGPIPCSDPNCFSLAVGLVREGKVLPISRYFPPYETWSNPDVAARLSHFADRLPQTALASLADDAVIDELLDLLADKGAGSDDDAGFSDWRNFFVVAIKPFMDANCYDQDRVDKCCTHVVDRAGNPVSLCEYNTLRRPRGLL